MANPSRKYTLTPGEVRATRVAIKVALAAHTALLGMSPDKDLRAMLMAEVILLGQVERKLEVE